MKCVLCLLTASVLLMPAAASAESEGFATYFPLLNKPGYDRTVAEAGRNSSGRLVQIQYEHVDNGRKFLVKVKRDAHAAIRYERLARTMPDKRTREQWGFLLGIRDVAKLVSRHGWQLELDSRSRPLRAAGFRVLLEFEHATLDEANRVLKHTKGKALADRLRAEPEAWDLLPWIDGFAVVRAENGRATYRDLRTSSVTDNGQGGTIIRLQDFTLNWGPHNVQLVPSYARKYFAHVTGTTKLDKDSPYLSAKSYSKIERDGWVGYRLRSAKFDQAYLAAGDKRLTFERSPKTKVDAGAIDRVLKVLDLKRFREVMRIR